MIPLEKMKSLFLILGLCLSVTQAFPKNSKRATVPSVVASSGSQLTPDKRLVCKLDFNKTSGNVVEDSSGYANNGYLMAGAILVNFKEGKCGNGAYTYCGDILFHGDTFQGKPYVGVTVAAWVKLKEIVGSHSIFDTIGASHNRGQFHFEVNNGVVRWFHRNESQLTVFSCNAEGQQVKQDKWTHIAGTYDSGTGRAKVYVNGLLRNMTAGAGLLSRDWLTRAGIGDHKANRPLKGFIDDFRIYNYALNKVEITALSKQCGLLQVPGPISDEVFEGPVPVLGDEVFEGPVPVLGDEATPPKPVAAAKKKKPFADISAQILDNNAPSILAATDDFLPLRKQPLRRNNHAQNVDSIEEAVLKRSHMGDN